MFITLAPAQRAQAIVTFGTNGFNGLNINTLVGADRWYRAGYNGSGAIITNIEAGLVWNGHETLNAQVRAFITPPTALGDIDRHATWVGQMLAGQMGGVNPGEHQRGIAFGATLWSGAIANNWRNVGTGRFSTTFDFGSLSFTRAYQTAMLSGMGGIRTDIVNSSWGFRSPDATSSFVRIIDSLVRDSGKLMVASAGNTGPASNTVGVPAIGFNTLAVGALTGASDPVPFTRVASFSSRGPIPFFDAGKVQIIPGVRAAVDIVAPGTDLTLARYGGDTGGNAFGGPVSTATDGYSTRLQGTSFAAPIVSAGAALLVDASHAPRNGLDTNDRARDGRTLKAVLMNSATKIPGWNNGQFTDTAGAVITTQALDFTSGAGALNLDQAFDQYLGGTRDLPGDGGGVVQPIGWDFGLAAEGSPVDYILDRVLDAGTMFTVTLTWWADSDFNLATLSTPQFATFDNLDVQVLEVINGVPATVVAQSISTYNSTEHLHFTLPRDGVYDVRVLWQGEVFDLVNAPNNELFAIAWAANPLPAPGGVALIVMFSLTATRRRRICT